MKLFNDRKAIWWIAVIPALLAALVSMPLAAVAQNIGLAEAKAPFRVVRGERTIEFPAGESQLLKVGDRVQPSSEPVLVRNENGRTILIDAQSFVSFPAEGFVTLEKGQVAVASPFTQPIEVAYQSLSFVPLGTSAESAAPAQLAVRVNARDEVQAIAYNEAFAAISNGEQPNQVAVLGNTDIGRFMRTPGGWQFIRVQNNNVSDIDPNNPNAVPSTRTCNCDSQLRLTELQGDFAGATPVDGMITVRQNQEDLVQPAAPGAAPGYSVVVDSAAIQCGDSVDIPVTVNGAQNLSSFQTTLVFDALCIGFKDIEEGLSAEGWDITAELIADGVVVIRGTADGGAPITGSGQLMVLKMNAITRCPCETALRVASLSGGLSGAQTMDGYAACQAVGAMTDRPLPPPPGGFAVQIGTARGLCAQIVEVPVILHQSPGTGEFEATILYNDRCLDYMGVEDGEATGPWKFKSEEPEKGVIKITGMPGEEGAPVTGGEIFRLKFRCGAPLLAIFPWPVSTGAAVGAVTLGTVAAIPLWNEIDEELDEDDDDEDTRGPGSPIGFK